MPEKNHMEEAVDELHKNTVLDFSDNYARINRIAETETVETSTGAKSSAGAPKYYLLSWLAIKGLVQHLTDGTTGNGGAARYGEGNWEKGGRDFLLDRFNHMVEHLFAFVNTPDLSDEEMKIHWRGIGCNWMFIMHFIEKGTLPKDLVYKWQASQK